MLIFNIFRRGLMPNLHKKILNGIYCMCDNDTATTTTTSQVMKKKEEKGG